MQTDFVPSVRWLSSGALKLFRRYYNRPNWQAEWILCETYSSVVQNRSEALEWFKPVVACFRGVSQEELLARWWDCLPKSIWPSEI